MTHRIGARVILIGLIAAGCGMSALARLSAQGYPDYEITTDAGEKFHLVHMQGSNYDIYTEADNKRIGSIDMRTNNPVVIGPDYAANGAAMQRGVAAAKEPGHMAAYQRSPSAPQSIPSVAAVQAQQLPEPVSGSVVTIDVAKGEATIMPTRKLSPEDQLRSAMAATVSKPKYSRRTSLQTQTPPSLSRSNTKEMRSPLR